MTATGADVVFTRRDDSPEGSIITGSYYWLEVYKDGQWLEMELIESDVTRTWTAIAYPINENSSREFTVAWEWLYGTLSTGKYRIGKEINYDWGENSHTRYVYAEFEIN